MYAVIELAGFQYRVEPEQLIQVPLLEATEGASLTLDQVLLVGDGESVKVGTPTVEGATVSATVVKHGRGTKLDAGKFIRRKDHRRRWGHRQDFTEIKISGIQG